MQISTLLFPFLGAALLLHAQTSNSSQPQTPPEQKQVVVVTGTWEPVPLEDADRSVNQYSLNNSPYLYSDLTDVFGDDPSVYIMPRGANGTQADISIRGASFEQTLLLLNGIRINDEQSAHYNSDFAIPLDAVQRVEILSGSGSTLYGADASGGVINILTQTAASDSPIEMRVRAGYGSFDTNEQSGFLAFRQGIWSQRFAFERELSTGFTDDRDYRNLAGSSESWLESKLGLTRVFLGYMDRPFGANQFYGPYDSWERTKTWLATISQDLGKRTLLTLGYRRHADLFVLFRDDPAFYTNRHIDTGWDAAIRRHDPIGKWFHAYYGVEITADTVNSNNLGQHARKQGAVYAAFDARALRRASISAGAREEFYGNNQTIFVPNVSGGYWLSSTVKVRGSASRAFRLPNYTDLYYSDPANVGNPNLKPEKADNFEGGVDWRPTEHIRVSGTAFERRERDDIDYVLAAGSNVWHAMNFDRLKFTGVDAEAAYSLAKNQTLSAGYTALHGAEGVLPAGYESKYVFNYPSQQAVLAWERIAHNGLVTRVRAGVTDQYERSTYVLVDASAAWTRSRVHPYLRVSNLTNADYQAIYGVTMPGRSITGGVELVVFGPK